MSLDQLAKAAKISRRNLIDIEHGKSGSALRVSHALAHALGVRLSELVDALCDGHEPPSPSERQQYRSEGP